MKARIKETGEIVDVLRWGSDGSYTVYVNSVGREINDATMNYYKDFELIEETKEIDWEQRRYEIALKAMEVAPKSQSPFCFVVNVMQITDILIKRLKDYDHGIKETDSPVQQNGCNDRGCTDL